MAKKISKSSQKKVSKSRAKKAPASKKTARRPAKRAPTILLTTEQRQALLNPVTNYDDVVDRFVRAWRAEGSRLKAPGYTPAKLASLLKKAERAAEKEERLRAKVEPQLAAAMDARMTAQDQLWRALIDIWAMAKAESRTQPEIADAFAFMTDVFPGGRKPAGEPG